jgi:hypothetical protein
VDKANSLQIIAMVALQSGHTTKSHIISQYLVSLTTLKTKGEEVTFHNHFSKERWYDKFLTLFAFTLLSGQVVRLIRIISYVIGEYINKNVCNL